MFSAPLKSFFRTILTGYIVGYADKIASSL